MLALFMKMSKLINYTTESSCTIYSYFNVEQRYGYVLRKEDDDWVKKCMEYEVDGPRPREDQRGPGERLSERTVKHVK